MGTIGDEVSVPLSNTGRKYGYITWRKKRDEDVSAIFGKTDSIDLEVGGKLQKNKRIDWERRRIGITYTVTRNLPKSIRRIHLQKSINKKVIVYFK